MKKVLLSIALCLACVGLFAQAVQPSLMVFPSNAWCHRNGFETIITKANGKEVRVQEYDKAFVENKELGIAVVVVGGLMKERGFELKDLHQDPNRTMTGDRGRGPQA